MMAPGHYLGTPALILGAGVLAGPGVIDPVTTAATALAAVPFAAGRASPDMDQYPPLKGRVAHRQITHWWGWPVLVLVAVGMLAPSAPGWVHGPALGWLAHLVLDAVFGSGRRKGVPLWPWKGSRRLGTGLRVGPNRSRVEKALMGHRRRHAVLEWIVTAAFVPLLVVETGILLAA